MKLILILIGIVLGVSLLMLIGWYFYWYEEDKKLDREAFFNLAYVKNLRTQKRCLDSIDRALDDALFWNNLSSIYLNAGLDDEGRLYYSMAHDILEGISGRRMKPYGYIPRGVEICKVG